MIDLKVPLLDLIDAHGEALRVFGQGDASAESALDEAVQIRQEIVARLTAIRSNASIGGATFCAVDGTLR